MSLLCEKASVRRSWEELTKGEKGWDEPRKRWDELSAGEKRWEELRRGGKRWDELRKGGQRWESLRRVGKRWKELSWGGKRWNKLWELLKRAVRIEKSRDGLRRAEKWWSQLNRVRQKEDEFTEQSWEAVRVRCISYRQTLSLDPIASQSLNLETSATRLARVLLVSYLYPWLMMLMGETSKKDRKQHSQIHRELASSVWSGSGVASEVIPPPPPVTIQVMPMWFLAKSSGNHSSWSWRCPVINKSNPMLAKVL